MLLVIYIIDIFLLNSNPADKTILPKKKRFNANYNNTEQQEKLLEISKNTPIESAVFITVNYGLRRSEVLGLKWNDINIKERTLSINQAIVKYNKETVIKKPKSENSRRILPLVKHVENYLKSLKNAQNKPNYLREKSITKLILFVAGMMAHLYLPII